MSNHDELMSNFFAQPDALAYGKVRFHSGTTIDAIVIIQVLWRVFIFKIFIWNLICPIVMPPFPQTQKRRGPLKTNG